MPSYEAQLSFHPQRNKKSDELVRDLRNEGPTTPGSVENPAKRLLNKNEIEYEKEKIKNIIAHEVATLQRLGETPEEILNTLRLERLTGIKDPPNPNSVQEAHMSDLPNAAIKDMQADESMILQTNRHMWRPSSLVHPLSHPSRYFQGMHLNLPQMNQPMYSRQNGPHLRPLPKHQDFLFRNGIGGRMFMPSSALNRPYFPTHNASQFSPNIERNLSDEMKRQLRDGKVVLLSDSVVRSNFTQEEGGSSVGKNETQKQH